MQAPLEIAFHNIKSTKWEVDLIRTRVAELDTGPVAIKICAKDG